MKLLSQGYRIKWEKRIKTPIITTGNELIKEQIVEFSNLLDLDELFQYISDVKGLIQMQFSRHWIMHIEACLQIRNRIHDV